MDTNNEILDAIEILADKKIGENITKVLTGIWTSVNINKNTCVMNSNGVSGTVYFYGSPPEVNGLYRIFVPSNDMSRAFIIVPPRFTVNPNLLDNWYFANPVNQRGLTEYTGNWIYTIDRWQLSDGNGTLKVQDGSIIFTSADYFFQPLPEDICKLLLGKMLTLSFLYADGTLDTGTVQITSWSGNWNIFIETGSIRIVGIANGRLWVLNTGAGKAMVAAKLELGDTQTLAHRENGQWVLNEVPDYGEQLRRCQRYYYQVHYVQYQTINMAYEDIAYSFIMLPLPAEMRLKIPVLTQSAPIVLGSSEKTLVGAEVSGCMARLGINYDANANFARSCYSYCPSAKGVTFTLSADL